MADSDEDYIASDDEEAGAHTISKGGRRGARPTKKTGKAAQKRERWEDIKRSWDNVVEGEDGNLSSTVAGLLEAGKRKRFNTCSFCSSLYHANGSGGWVGVKTPQRYHASPERNYTASDPGTRPLCGHDGEGLSAYALPPVDIVRLRLCTRVL